VRTAIDPALAACVPPGAVLVAGADLGALRRSSLYPNLPASARAFLAPFDGFSSALAAYDGKDLLIAARGQFASAPAGAVVLAPGIAVFGAPEAVAAGKSQFAARRPGAPDLLAQAETVASAPIWIAARGEAPLPLSGNLANLARILQ